MASQRHTLESVARHLIRAARPLVQVGASAETFAGFAARIGFRATSVPPGMAALSVKISAANVKVDGFAASAPLADVLLLLADAKAVFDGIANLRASPPGGVDPGAWSAEIGDGLFALLFVDYVAREFPTAFGVLGALGVIRFDNVLPSPGRPAFVRPMLDWSMIGSTIAKPAEWPLRAFDWGKPSFDASVPIEHALRLFHGLGFVVSFAAIEEQRFKGYGGAPNRLPRLPSSLRVPFMGTRFAGKPLMASFALVPLPADGAKLPGLVLEADLPADLPLELELHPKAKLRLRAGTAGAPFGIVVRPNEIGLRYPFAPGTPPPSAGLSIAFDFTTGRTLLFGDPTGSRVEFGGASIELAATFVNGAWSTTIAPELRGLKVVIDPGKGDGFLTKVLGKNATSVDVPLGLEWGAHGIRFKGSPAFDVAVHPHVQIGPVRVNDVDLRLGVLAGPPSGAMVEIGAGISGELGPLKLFIDGIGLRMQVAFAKGNAGPVDIDVGFKWPRGVGLEIDTGGFKGGGFLIFDKEKGEYAGGLELMFQGIVSVRAVGILGTRMPDGSEGFSLLIVIVSEFPPLQLSFGFTLLGVGGLLGMNRTVLLEMLQSGVRDGSLGSILFPVDIVANAGRIVSDLRRIFPAQEGRFLIGPMAKLGWGTPTLISLELGIILEIPRPMFAIVGVLRLALPAEDLALLHLQVSFAGSVDFEKGQLAFDASLFDSRVLNFTLTGDMAVRVYWKENANFLLTVGGFHPAYTPPPMNLGPVARLGIMLFQGNPNVRAEAYFAVTSNTVQFGARVEAYFGVDIFNVYGFLGLDVLIHFDPFHFIAELAAMLAVRSGRDVLFSINVQMLLEGPTPWHARGTGSFEISFIIDVTISVSFDVTVGSASDTKLPPVDVVDALVDALSQRGNWRAKLPSNSHQHVVLRELPNVSEALILHPFGTLEVTQKVAPLAIAIQRFGSRSPANGTTFGIANVKLNGADAAVSAVREQFAPAQFFAMSDAEQLSRPSFAQYDAGVHIGGDLAPKTDFMRERDVEYEIVYLPQRHPIKLLFKLADSLASFLTRGGAASRSSISQSALGTSPLAQKVNATGEQYAVVSSDDLTLHAAGMVFDNATAADQALRALAARDRSLAGSLQVVPATSIARETA